MAGDISTPDFTAMSLVHKRMLRNVEIAEKITICEYLSKLSDFISNLSLTFDAHYNFNLERLEHQRRFQRAVDNIVRAEDREAESVIYLRNRPKRYRRAPERLNITSTKSKSYLE